MQGNGYFLSLGHALDCIGRYFVGCVAGPSTLSLPLVLYGCTLSKGIGLNQNREGNLGCYISCGYYLECKIECYIF